MHVDIFWGDKSMFVHQTYAVIVGRAPNTGMARYWQGEVTRRLERSLFVDGRITGNVESNLHTQHIAAPVYTPFDKVGKLRRPGPFPGSAEQVAISEDESARNSLKRIHCRVGIFHRLQAVRPVNRCGDPGIHGLKRAQQISSIDILGAEVLAPVQIVKLEVVRERPICAKPAQRRLPHMAMGIDHTGHQNAAARVDLHRSIWRSKLASDGSNAFVDDENIPMLD